MQPRKKFGKIELVPDKDEDQEENLPDRKSKSPLSKLLTEKGLAQGDTNTFLEYHAKWNRSVLE